jgi:predicted transcriptional regulator
MEKRNDNFIGLDSLLEILGNPTRRLMLSKLAKVPHSPSELASELGISRQAVHSQLEILSKNDIIQKVGEEKRGNTYKIKSDISLRVNITPDYYGIKFRTSEIKSGFKSIQLKDTDISTDYKRKSPNDKIRLLGEKIKTIENTIRDLEIERRNLLQNKQCYIVELKNIMDGKYKEKLRKTIMERQFKAKNIKESLNLIEEIFLTLFFNPNKYDHRINIDSLIDDIYFSDMDSIERAQSRISIEPLLKDLSRAMDLFREGEDDWFFDI